LLFFAHFRFFTLIERAKERSLFLSLFLKEQKSDSSFGRSFEKSKKRVIAHLLFLKELMSKRLLNCSFERSGNEQ